jgi:4-alpha-glucanotransferase
MIMSMEHAASELFHTLSQDKWKRIGAHKRAGIVAPLFYVYSKKSTGIGDFCDLKLLIDWCEKTGNSILQLLPMNELSTTFCPYDSISSFALEPAYVCLEAIPAAGKKPILNAISELKRAYPAGAGRVDYRIKAAKLKILWDIYLGDANAKSKEFQDFIAENEYWINDFALFKAVKEFNGGKEWYTWPEQYRDRDYIELKKFKKSHEKEIIFHAWVQWQLYKQFKEVKDYATAKKVFMKGDLPILVSRDSADVWSHIEFFKLDFAAGAPPDMYCAKGQRWGMPTYDWEAKSSDDYRYLKEKLKYAENFYDILRVDHVVGLFRIWSIPYNEPQENCGLNGSFDPSDEGQWDRHGREILSVILDNTKMLLCAEDLGMIPESCPRVLKEYGVPGNEVQRWVKDWNLRHDFLNPEEYRHVSVAMLSTHDTTNWAAWWENEAGTVDEELFIRKCGERGIDYQAVKSDLFDEGYSRHGRLRWLDNVDSVETLAAILNRRTDELWDFINMYENTFREKEKLWEHLKLKGPMREKADAEIINAAFKITLAAKSIFSIELLVDVIGAAGMLKGDPYQYRINTPGTVSANNWSLTAPVALEDMLANDMCKHVKVAIASSGRAVTP